MSAPRKRHICKRCGAEILFMPRGGFVIKGQSRYYPANLDGSPHGPTCKLNQALRAEKRKASAKAAAARRVKPAAPAAPTQPTQGEMFNATTHRTSRNPDR